MLPAGSVGNYLAENARQRIDAGLNICSIFVAVVPVNTAFASMISG
jgi:hypothetical protein